MVYVRFPYNTFQKSFKCIVSLALRGVPLPKPRAAQPQLFNGVYASHVPQWAGPNRFFKKKTVVAERCMLSLTALYIIIYKSSDDLVAGLTSPKCYDFARHCVLFLYRLSCSRKTISNLARLHIILLSVTFACSIPLTSPDSCWLEWLRRFIRICCHQNPIVPQYIHNPFVW